MKPPKHPISDATLPHQATHYAIPVACVWCTLHTTSDSSPGGSRPGACPFRAVPKPAQIRRMSVAQAVSRLSGKARCAGRPNAFEPPLLRADGYPLTRSDLRRTCASAGPFLMVCVHHADGSSHAIMFVVITAFRRRFDCDTPRSAPGPARSLPDISGRVAVDHAGRRRLLGLSVAVVLGLGNATRRLARAVRSSSAADGSELPGNPDGPGAGRGRYRSCSPGGCPTRRSAR